MRFKITNFFDTIAAISLILFSPPALIIPETQSPNPGIISLKAWSLIMIVLIDIFVICTSFLLRRIEINLQILKNLSALLTAILGLMTYGVSSMITQILLAEEISWIVAYQILTTIILGLLFGTLLYFMQLHLKLEGQADTTSVPVMSAFLVLTSKFIFHNKNESLDLSQEAFIWVRVSSLLTLLFSLSLYFVFSARTWLANNWKELYTIAYVPACIYWCYHGVIHIAQEMKTPNPSNLRFLIFTSWILFWGIAPAIFQVVICIIKLTCTRSRRRNTQSQNTNNEIIQNPIVEADYQSLRHIKLEEAKERNCPICWEEFKRKDNIIARDSCYHSYHVTCLRKWMLGDSRCPLCRGFIKNIE